MMIHFLTLGFLFGLIATFAERAIRILNYEVEKVTTGSISKNVMLISLSLGVGISIALSMNRIWVGLPLSWFIVPGYAIVMILAFISKDRFISIAFDAGGVATGPMTATFIMAIAGWNCFNRNCGRGISFVLPVEQTVGIHHLIKTHDEEK